MFHVFKDPMTSKFPLWSAVLAGMASPASLYAEPPDYQAYAKRSTAVHGFASAGAYLTNSMARLDHVGKSAAAAKPARRFRKA